MAQGTILPGEEGPITIKGGSVEVKLKKSELPEDSNDKDKHYSDKKQLTRLVVTGRPDITLGPNDKIEIYYKPKP